MADPILDDSRGRLGCGINGAFITSQCGFPTVCVLDNILELNWGRVLDGVSEGFVRIGLGGDQNASCCDCLREVEPYCHELHFTRDGIEEWAGPITQVIYSYSEVIINAQDVVGWLEVKIPSVDIDFRAVATDLTTIAETILDVALAESNECILTDIQSYPNSISGKRFFPAFSATALEMLNDLAETGLNYTTLGRSIILSGDIDQLTPLIILRDENIVGEVEVTKDGLLAGNRYYIHFKDDGGLPGDAETLNTYCYGFIERMRTEDSIETLADAQATAQIYVDATQIAPRTLVVPPGSRLSPETPWTIAEMVCGTRVDVQLSKLCFEVEQSFILTEMQLVETPEDGEQILITLTPINDVGI